MANRNPTAGNEKDRRNEKVVTNEATTAGLVDSMRHPPGRGSQLTPDERREIQRLALIAGCSQSEIARRTGRDRGTVAAVLRSQDTIRLREELESEAADEARRTLAAYTGRAAHAWTRAVENAADKGQHQAARDLLLHTKVIEPIDADKVTVGVQVVLGAPGFPYGPDPVTGEWGPRPEMLGLALPAGYLPSEPTPTKDRPMTAGVEGPRNAPENEG